MANNTITLYTLIVDDRELTSDDIAVLISQVKQRRDEALTNEITRWFCGSQRDTSQACQRENPLGAKLSP